MAPGRTALLNVRMDPRLKEALRIASTREHRSISNMLEWLVRQHCERAGISIPEQGSFALESDDGRKKP
jgi:hypothetical protein